MPSQSPLQICFIPYFGAASHTFALLDIARYFAFHGQKVTIITTKANATTRIQKFLGNDTTPSDQQIQLHTIALPLQQVGLPIDFDELNQPEDFQEAAKLYRATHMLRRPIQELLENDKVDCIISDVIFPWYADIAAHLGIPCISFTSLSIFASCIDEALRSPDSPHHSMDSDEQAFLVPGLPVPIEMTKAELPTAEYFRFFEGIRSRVVKSNGVLFNSFEELESDYAEFYSKVTGMKVFNIGPASELHRCISGSVERGYSNTKADEHHCLSWLISKKSHKILYVNFGTVVKFSDEQLMEIACALQSSGQEFIWVVRNKVDEKEETEGKWLPEGFHEKIEGRGILVKGWAPQLSILDHPSIGGFMTHCGWNSLLEGFSAGVPMITWPSTFDQFYNEKFVVQVAGVGVGVGAKEWANWFDNGKKIIERETIEKAIEKLMNGGDKAEEMRRKAKEYGKMAKRAVEEGGSSYMNMINLVEDLKIFREVKTQ